MAATADDFDHEIIVNHKGKHQGKQESSLKCLLKYFESGPASAVQPPSAFENPSHLQKC